MLFPTKKPMQEEICFLSITDIVPNPAQPRTVFDAGELDKLTESIRENGLLQPVTVRRVGEGFELISGERRLRACTRLGMKHIRAIILDVDDYQSAVFALLENLQREDLCFFDEARGIYELIYRWGLTQEAAACKLGIAQSTLANKLRLLRLPRRIQDLIMQHGLTERHARALLRLTEEEQQEKVIAAVVSRALNVTQTERFIDALLEEAQPHPRRLLVVKDLRIFLNTIDRAVSTMKEAGIEATVVQSDEQDYIEYTVRIPKQSAYRRHMQQLPTLQKVIEARNA